MAKSGERYSAFVDLLATKQSLDIGADAYQSALRIFRQAIAGNIKFLDSADRVFVFSDSCYLSITNLENFHKFVIGLRADLLIDRLFFRGSLVDGDLEVEDFSSTVSVSHRKKASGSIFGENAVKAFQLHERTKGIAVVSNVSGGAVRDLLVNSAFIDIDVNSVSIIKDFRYEFDDIDHQKDCLERLRKETKKQNTRSRRIGRYYITPFISWVNSQSFSRIAYDDATRSFSTSCPIVEWLVDASGYREIKLLQGHENIYFSLIQKMSLDCAHESALFKLYDFVRSRPGLAEKIGRSDVRIISEGVKNDLLNHITN